MGCVMEGDTRKKLARRLRELRKKHGYSQQELAERADLDYKHVQLLESSKAPYARLDTLEHLAKAFGITPSKLLDF